MSSGKKRRQFVVSIGTRLTIWGAGLTTLMCALICAALYGGIKYSLRSQIDVFLEGEIDEFLLTVNEYSGDKAGLQQAIRHELGVRDRNDLGFRLLDERGKIIVSSVLNDPLDGCWTPPIDWTTRNPGVICETLVPMGDTHAYRVCNRITVGADGQRATAQTSYLLDQMTQSLSAFRRVAALVLAFAFLISLAVGGFLSRRSLQPIRNIMQTAHSIGLRDLGSRIALSGSGDEMDQLADTLNRMLERIERQVFEIQQFTADASHELRTPLTALRGGAEVALSKQRSADELRRTIEDSIEQYDRLHRIAEDLLLLAQHDTGKSLGRREAVSLERVLIDIMDIYAPIADEKRISLVMNHSEPVYVQGDGGRLRQVVSNLVDNAIKYTPLQGKVGLSLAMVNGSAEIQVEDTGIGIAANDLPKIFDRFFRADSSRSTPGVGLGLSICRSIIQAHGGDMTVESQLHKGTTVRLSLPCEQKSVKAIA